MSWGLKTPKPPLGYFKEASPDVPVRARHGTRVRVEHTVTRVRIAVARTDKENRARRTADVRIVAESCRSTRAVACSDR